MKASGPIPVQTDFFVAAHRSNPLIAVESFAVAAVPAG
jgi:hypothetical protein